MNIFSIHSNGSTTYFAMDEGEIWLCDFPAAIIDVACRAGIPCFEDDGKIYLPMQRLLPYGDASTRARDLQTIETLREYAQAELAKTELLRN